MEKLKQIIKKHQNYMKNKKDQKSDQLLDVRVTTADEDILIISLFKILK